MTDISQEELEETVELHSAHYTNDGGWCGPRICNGPHSSRYYCVQCNHRWPCETYKLATQLLAANKRVSEAVKIAEEAIEEACEQHGDCNDG
jgi:hypothetical protein